MLTSNSFDRIHFRQYFTGNTDDFLPCRRDLCQMFTAAGKNLDPEFIFQHPHLFADPRLRRVQAFCRRTDVQIVINNLYDVAQLLQFHISYHPGFKPCRHPCSSVG
ncbi:hypothetical protein SRABI106_03188 [Rahnella aquatilis]|nr:hypothetical protein SRABI106_03188 [Rahnella aquatilis]